MVKTLLVDGINAAAVAVRVLLTREGDDVLALRALGPGAGPDVSIGVDPSLTLLEPLPLPLPLLLPLPLPLPLPPPLSR